MKSLFSVLMRSASGACSIQNRNGKRPSVIIACLAALATLLLHVPTAMAQTAELTVLHSFGGHGDASGINPIGNLVQGSDGNFYGTTYGVLDGSNGAVFRITPAGVLIPLHVFSGRMDGAHPYDGLVQGNDGNFYGTTCYGGNGKGTVFKITTTGELTTLYAFDGDTDGEHPAAGLVQGNDGNFYGTTGGVCDTDSLRSPYGTVFKITPAGELTTLHSFRGIPDGGNPSGRLVQGNDGNFYGTTRHGGSFNVGSVFEITPAGAFTRLHSFRAQSDGSHPSGGLVQGNDGSFYGTTRYGGGVNNNSGSAFRITPTAGVLTRLFSFGFGNGAGSWPFGGLIQGDDGNFYGTTFHGGGTAGTVFMLTAAGSHTRLHTFSGVGAGKHPAGGLVKGSDGNFYGTTSSGGGYDNGTVFKVTLLPTATPSFNLEGGTYTGTQSVAISSSTPDATIRYTINGSTPTVNSPLYSGPITVSSSRTIRANAIAGGYSYSAVTSATYTIQHRAVTPAFSLASGTYTGTQSVTISTSTSGAAIRYTTDGSTPTTSSTQYTGPITVSSSQTIRAIATASGYANSTVASAAYMIRAETPTFSLASGTYTDTQSVTISTSTSGAAIRYTIDGSTPSANSTLYTGPITVSSSQTIRAITTGSGYANSAVASAAYTIQLPVAATPTFSFRGGTYWGYQQPLEIRTTTPDASIRYTTDGSTPTPSSTLYTGPIILYSNQTVTIKAITIASGYANSAVASETYTIPEATATPSFSPEGATYTGTQSVTISSSTPDAVIRYTTNGSTPNVNSLLYSGPITVSSSQTIKAIAIASDYANSDVASATYTIQQPAATPSFNLPGGTYTGAQSVTIITSTSGAAIRYTTDGSTPTVSSTLYTGPITISNSQTIRAITTASGYANSTVASAAYTIQHLAATPSFNLSGGTYTGAQSVTISSSTPSAAIRYTTNGSTPTASSTLYAGPVAVSSSQTIQAIAIADGYANSAVASVTYTIQTPELAATPVFNPTGGTYTGTQNVTISTSTSGAAIRYTTDGSTPSASSTLYTGPVAVSSSQTIRAITTASGYANSAVSSATYTIQLPAAATPTFGLVGGTYTGPQSVTISSSTSGAAIRYTTNGSTPTTSSTLYTSPITVSSNKTIRAIATANGYANSSVASAMYTISVIDDSNESSSGDSGGATNPVLLGLLAIAVLLRRRRFKSTADN